MRSKFYILSPETQEEKFDLEYLMNKNGLKYETYTRRKFSKFRYIIKIVEVISFIKFIRTFKKKYQQVVIIGAPCLRNRLVGLLLRIPFFYYLRCLHPTPEHLSSISDKIDFLFKKIGINNSLTNNYMSEKHIITSELTADFLRVRKAGNNFINIGPIWLKKISLKKNNKKRRVIFITQSFFEHRFYKAQIAQNRIIEKIASIIGNKGYEFILKVHPRDKDIYNGYSIFNGNALDLLNDITENDIVLSAFSTLAFELDFIGANVKFISYLGISDLYDKLYLRHGIRYHKIDDEMSLDFLNERKVNYNIFNKIRINVESEIS